MALIEDIKELINNKNNIRKINDVSRIWPELAYELNALNTTQPIEPPVNQPGPVLKQYPGADLQLPLAEGTYRKGSPWGNRAGGFHYGYDFEADMGTPIYSPCAGVVHYARAMSGWGSVVVITTQLPGGPVDVLMGHMKLSDTVVKEGQNVTKGQYISKIGSEGDSSGPHLHVSVFDGTNWNYGSESEDPTPWFFG